MEEYNETKNEEIEIEMDVLPTPESIDIDYGLNESKILKRLEISNIAMKSWIPSIFAGFFLIILGMYFLFVQFGSWTVDSIVSVSLIGNGLVLFFIAKKESYIFDQTKGILELRRITWKGVNTTEYWLLHIKDVIIEEYKDPQGGTDFELYLTLLSGQRLKLFSGHIIGVGKIRKEKAKNDIKEFLNHFKSKYTTKSRASHSDFKRIMKKQLSHSSLPK